MGTNRLVGTRGDDILRAWRELRDGGPTQCERPPLWDGRASERVLDAIERWRRADGAPEAIRAVAQ
jgi:hypothetical protein